MSDNAGSHDSSKSEVHPEPVTEVEDGSSKDTPSSPKPPASTSEAQDTPREEPVAGPSRPRPPSPTATPPPLPPTEPEQNGTDTLFANAEDEEGLDPDTLANLAALSRLARDEGDDEDEEGEAGAGGDNDFSTLMADSQHSMTREQMQEIVARLAQSKDDDEENQDAEGEDEGDPDADAEGEDDTGNDTPPVEGQKREESELREIGDEDRRKAAETKGDVKEGTRKRAAQNAIVECFRLEQNTATATFHALDGKSAWHMCRASRSDEISIARGVPALCRMEAPILPFRKPKRPRAELHITQELRSRVQALEQLIKSGLTLDPDQASSMATETIHQATRAAQSGSLDATNALAQLTRSSGGLGIGGMTSEAQNMLLMDVLQQLSGQGNAKTEEGEDKGPGQGTWSNVPQAIVLGTASVQASFEADQSATKIDLSVPGFREETGSIFIPPTVRHVEKQLRNERILLLDPLPIQGLDAFLDVGTRLAYGQDSPAYRKERICAIQSYSITGAMRIASTFISRFPSSSGTRVVHVPSPTSPEDLLALKQSGMEIRQFRFLDYKLGGIDWEGLREDLSNAPPRSAVLLHVSGSMPSGAEFTAPQWRHLTTILLERQLIPLVVMASQGLSSGDVNRDAQPLRFMIHEGVPVVLVQSFDSMMGIYTDSPSIVSVVVRNGDEKDRVNSQLRSLGRETYSHPSPWGAHVVHSILSSPKLYSAWLNEIKAMSDRLRSVRDKLHDVIANKLKTPGSWGHIKKATGMYCATLLPPALCEALARKRHIYILAEGCVSLGALNAAKIDMLARGIDQVIREGIREAEEAREQAIAMELALQAAKEQAAREEAEAQAAAAAAEEERAREEDTLMMERSIASAMEAQKRLEEEEKMREEADREMVETLRKAEERAAIARQAEAILASITGGDLG